MRPLWLAALALGLILLFVTLGFPYERLSSFVSSRVGELTGARVTIRELGPSLHLAGPGFTGKGIHATLASGRSLEFDRAVMRPAWSLSWLRGRAAIYTQLEGPVGSAVGVFTTGVGGGYAGELLAADLARLPLVALWPGASFEGQVDAEIDVRREPGGPQGWASFDAVDGSIALAGFPLAVPFEQLSGSLRFGEDAFLEIETVTLDGPLLSAEVTGRVEKALAFDRAPLHLQIQLTAEPAIRSALRAAGVRLGEDGTARVRIGGSPSRPTVR